MNDAIYTAIKELTDNGTTLNVRFHKDPDNIGAGLGVPDVFPPLVGRWLSCAADRRSAAKAVFTINIEAGGSAFIAPITGTVNKVAFFVKIG